MHSGFVGNVRCSVEQGERPFAGLQHNSPNLIRLPDFEMQTIVAERAKIPIQTVKRDQI
jgi:hypothetical protein